MIIPPIPFEPYLVFSNNSGTLICVSVLVSAIAEAIIAGSKAWILTLLGLEAKLAPALIKSS